MVNTYIPAQGDIVFLNFSPHQGHEQGGNRPALVISSKIYNAKSQMVLLCPITRQVKNYPFEVKLPQGLKTEGVILADHIKNFDWKARQVTFIEKISQETLKETIEKLKRLIEMV